MKRSLWIDTWDQSGFQQTFWRAVDKGDTDMMHHVAEKGVNIANFEKVQWTPAHTIAYSISRQDATESQISTLKRFFSKYSNYLTKLSVSGNSPVHLACYVNNSQILSIIMNLDGGDVDLNKLLNQPKKDKYWEENPLMIAIEYESVDCVELLCNYAEIDILNHKSRDKNLNAFEIACLNNNYEIVKHVLSRANSNDYLNDQLLEASLNLSKNGANSSQQRKCVDLLLNILSLTTADKHNDVDHILDSCDPQQKSNYRDWFQGGEFPYRCPKNHPSSYTSGLTLHRCVICDERGWTKCSVCGVNGVLCETCSVVMAIAKTPLHNRQAIMTRFDHKRILLKQVMVNILSIIDVE